MNSTLTIQGIITSFNNEFSVLATKFVIIDLEMATASAAQGANLAKPGVYLFWNPTYGVIKVGRSLENSHKRAFEHLRDNTTGGSPRLEMKMLSGDPDSHLLLFNLLNPRDFHWAAALEIYFESNLNPHIKSGRTG